MEGGNGLDGAGRLWLWLSGREMRKQQQCRAGGYQRECAQELSAMIHGHPRSQAGLNSYSTAIAGEMP